MTDIVCRVCGEPWDSTGGLHHSHSDMTWWQYDQLVHGVGCPCCEGTRPEGLSSETMGDFYGKWLSSIHYLSEGTLYEQEALEAPPWCFTGVWDDGNEHRVIPLFFIQPGVDWDDEDKLAWRWVGEKPDKTEKGAPERSVTDQIYTQCLAQVAGGRVTDHDFPPGCRYTRREDIRAQSYGVAVPHAPYFDHYFAGVALIPRYRGEHDEPSWQEILKRHASITEDLDVKTASELASLVADGDEGLYHHLAPSHIDNDEDADHVLRANYQALEAEAESKKFDLLYDGPDIWVRVGHYNEGEGDISTDAVRWCYDVEAALADYPCVDDELASRLECEDQQKQIGEWLEAREDELEQATGLRFVTVKLLIAGMTGEKSPFYHESGEFVDDPEIDAIVESLAEHLPPLLGWHPIETLEPSSIYVVPECPASCSSWRHDGIPGYLLWIDTDEVVHVDWSSRMPPSQLKLARLSNGLREMDWACVPATYRAAFRAALSDDGDYFDTDMQ